MKTLNDTSRQMDGNYDEKAYQLAMQHTKYNADGKAVIENSDEWRDEKEWDALFKQLSNPICSDMKLTIK